MKSWSRFFRPKAALNARLAWATTTSSAVSKISSRYVCKARMHRMTWACTRAAVSRYLICCATCYAKGSSKPGSSVSIPRKFGMVPDRCVATARQVTLTSVRTKVTPPAMTTRRRSASTSTPQSWRNRSASRFPASIRAGLPALGRRKYPRVYFRCAAAQGNIRHQWHPHPLTPVRWLRFTDRPAPTARLCRGRLREWRADGR